MSARLMRAAALVLAAAMCAGANDPAAPADKTPAPDVAKDVAPEKPAPPPDLTRVKADLKAKTVTLEGVFCLRRGILDYLAVTTTGHEYEAVLALNAKASLLHANLLAIGAEAGPTETLLEAIKKNAKPGDKVPEKIGTKLRAVVEWQADGKTVSIPASGLLTNRTTKKPAEDAPWIFTGSYFAKDPNTDKDVYMGDADQSLIGVFFQQSAVVNFSKDNGNAYDGTETGHEVNTDIVPKPGTACKLVFSFWDKPAEPAK